MFTYAKNGMLKVNVWKLTNLGEQGFNKLRASKWLFYVQFCTPCTESDTHVSDIKNTI